MDNDFGAYQSLRADDAEASRRCYTIELVQRRKNRIMSVLLPLLSEEPTRELRISVSNRIAAVLAPGAKTGSPQSARRQMKGSTSQFIDGLPFLPTPEVTDPRGISLSFPVEESLGYADGTVPTLEHLRALAWRLAGNAHKLIAGEPVSPWSPDRTRSEWCLAKVVDVKNELTFDGDPGFRLTYFFYSGAPAGLEFSRVFKSGHEARFGNALGLSWKKSTLLYPQELIGMTGYVKLEASWGKDKTPLFRETQATGSHATANRKLYQDRLDPEKCPYGYKPNTIRSCMECPLACEESAEAGVNLTCRLAVRRYLDGFDGANASDAASGGGSMVRPGA